MCLAVAMLIDVSSETFVLIFNVLLHEDFSSCEAVCVIKFSHQHLNFHNI